MARSLQVPTGGGVSFRYDFDSFSSEDDSPFIHTHDVRTINNMRRHPLREGPSAQGLMLLSFEIHGICAFDDVGIWMHRTAL